MSKQFDAAAKKLIDTDLLAFVRFFGMPGRAATVLDSDLNLPITADRLIRIDDPDYLAHVELQASRDPMAEWRFKTYAANAGYKHFLPVATTVILLRKQADRPRFTGLFKIGGFTWEYRVYRLWEISPEQLLAGPPPIVPLAPLSKVTAKQMPGVVREMRQQLGGLPLQEQRELWSIADMLMGLKYKPEQLDRLLKGIYDMLDLSESTSYQRILAEGRAEGREEGRMEGRMEGERSSLLRTSARRLGPPDERTRIAIEAIASREELERLGDRLFEVETWDDLLR